MKIAIFTLGTRGDVQPYAVLGQALKARGHQITFSTAKNFDALVAHYGLDFVPVEADFQALLHSEEGKKIRKNPFMARKLLQKVVYPMMADALERFYRLAQENDRVIFHIKTMADNFADQFPEKMIKADVVPAGEPTSAFPNPVFAMLPSFMNKFTYKITEWGLSMWKKPVNDFRRNAGLPERFNRPKLPSIYGISELFLPKPPDYPVNAHFTGFWLSPSQEPLEERTTAFLNSGAAPIVITFGSMPFDSKLDLVESIETIATQTHHRIIVIKGWGLSDTERLESNTDILVVDSVPYDKLFPKVKAIIHHGGIGTIAACLVAGKPFLSCPVLYPMGDQYFWGSIAYRKGVALKPIPLKKLTTNTLVENARKLVNDQTLSKKANDLARKLQQENGVANAIRIIESSVRDIAT